MFEMIFVKYESFIESFVKNAHVDDTGEKIAVES